MFMHETMATIVVTSADMFMHETMATIVVTSADMSMHETMATIVVTSTDMSMHETPIIMLNCTYSLPVASFSGISLAFWYGAWE